VSVCPSVCHTLVYSIETAKGIINLFLDLAAIHSVFELKRRYIIPRGTPSAGALILTGYDEKSQFSAAVSLYLENDAK